METESKIRSFLARTLEQLNEQQWFQELRVKWDELDPQSKVYLKTAVAAGTVIAFLSVIVSSIVSVSSIKSELNEKTELLTMVRNATEEIRTLKRVSPASGAGTQGEAVKWDRYFGSKAASSGISAESVTISPEKQGNPGTSTMESMFTVELSKINIRQAVQYAFALENGTEPIKVKNLRIHTVGDEGWLNARLEVSAFAMKKESN